MSAPAATEPFFRSRWVLTPAHVRELGGKNLEGPEVCPGYSPGYYAFFFEDPDGNKLEICCREQPIVAE